MYSQLRDGGSGPDLDEHVVPSSKAMRQRTRWRRLSTRASDTRGQVQSGRHIAVMSRHAKSSHQQHEAAARPVSKREHGNITMSQEVSWHHLEPGPERLPGQELDTTRPSRPGSLHLSSASAAFTERGRGGEHSQGAYGSAPPAPAAGWAVEGLLGATWLLLDG